MNTTLITLAMQMTLVLSDSTERPLIMADELHTYAGDKSISNNNFVKQQIVIGNE